MGRNCIDYCVNMAAVSVQYRVRSQAETMIKARLLMREVLYRCASPNARPIGLI